MKNERNWSHDPIKMRAKDTAEYLFKKHFQENMKRGTIQQFKETYPTLYFQVIVPMAIDLLLKELHTAQQRDELRQGFSDVADMLIKTKYFIQSGAVNGHESMAREIDEVLTKYIQ